MSSINLKRNIFETFVSKGLILVLNFFVVVMTTRLWGAEGRGSIAFFVADLGIIAIFANVFTESSVSYFFSRLGASKLATFAYLWSFIVSAIGASIVLAMGETALSPFIFVVACLMGIIAFNNSLFIGGQKIANYNLMTVLQPALLLVCMLLFYWLFPDLGCYCYFYGQLVSLLVMILVCRFLRRRMEVRLHWDLDWQAGKQVFSYGWKSELSNLLQFFNYRLTYYLLDFYVSRGSVGIFSIGVTIAEAIWIVNRSMATVQFSNVLKQGNTRQSRSETLTIATISLVVSAVCLGVVLLLPNQLFAWIFGPEFAEVKTVVLWLTPGILAIAFSNVLSDYFSAILHLNILIIKSALGLVVAITMGLILIPKMGIEGACIVNSASYLFLSMVVLLYYLSKKSKSGIHE